MYLSKEDFEKLKRGESILDVNEKTCPMCGTHLKSKKPPHKTFKHY